MSDNETTRPAAVLIGPPGSGKSTVGPLLAARLGVTFRDTDADIEARAGLTVPDIFVTQGEERFRELEREAVAAALTGHDGVLSLGGGAVMADATRELLRGHNVVYLEVAFPVVVKRVGIDASRPLLIGNPRAQLKKLLDARVPVYEAAGTHTVNTDHRSPDEVAEAILAALGAPARA
ncbi:MAG TPA: shikimate kinase [Streptosporangiaceae bacterium]|jgi:shikimate kinase